MKTLFTPGPWKTSGVPDYDTLSIWTAHDNGLHDRLVAEMRIDDDGDDLENDVANAHLIAAAPEMLDALKASLTLIESGTLRIGPDVDTSVIGKIKAVIRKATHPELI